MSRRPRSLRILSGVLAAAGALAAAGTLPATADHPQPTAAAFGHLATFDVMAGNGSAVAEIVDVSRDGRQLVYTDAPSGEIGFVNISDPSDPVGLGTLAMGGEPTSLAIAGRYILVAVNTSPSFVAPSGHLAVVDRFSRAVVATHDLGGQPDSIALAPNGRRAVVVIENERDEDFDDGLLPQAPTGAVLVVDLLGPPAGWGITPVDLAAVAAIASDGSDLEPEYVDVNRANLAVVSFQENNHLAVIDIVTKTVVESFSAGSVVLNDVDTAEEDLINLDSTITRRREPDAVAWIDNQTFATANEGDYTDALDVEGGSRGFTVFSLDGTVRFESAESFEHLLVSVGHYNESRSENKGVEPESVEVGTFRGQTLMFVGSERSNAVGVYRVFPRRSPQLLQVLPTGIGPEGLKAVESRGLFIVATETDEAEVGIPTMINIFGQAGSTSRYPKLVSDHDADGLPIPWVALSGLAGHRTDGSTLYAVSDSFLAEGFIYTIDTSTTPARIVERTAVTGASSSLDLEGIAVGPDGNFWLGSEGSGPGGRPNLVLEVDPAGAVVSEIPLPAAMVDMRRSNGIEGIAVTGDPGAEVVYVAIQRAWPDEGDTDEVNTKIGRYDVATGTWGFVHYPLEPEGDGDWIGLSELTLLPDGTFAVVERDKGWGPTTGFVAELKAVFGVDLASADFRAFDDPAGLVTLGKTLLADLLPTLEAASIWTPEKLEGLAVGADGTVWMVTDNDGVDGATGETIFLRLGPWRTALGG